MSSGRKRLKDNTKIKVNTEKAIKNKKMGEIKLNKTRFNKKKGVLMAMAVGDALGRPFEFRDFRYPPPFRLTKLDMEDGWRNDPKYKAGLWTDDAAQGAALIDTLIQMAKDEERTKKREFPSAYFMENIYQWFTKGLYSGLDSSHPYSSIGLGGVVSQAINNWREQKEKDLKGDYPDPAKSLVEYRKTHVDENGILLSEGRADGNGSTMRVGACAVFARGQEEAMALAKAQSEVTTPGAESSACAQLLSFLTYQAIESTEEPAACKTKLLSRANLQKFLNYLDKTDPAYDMMVALCHGELTGKGWLNWRTDKDHYQWDKKAPRDYYGAYATQGLAFVLHVIQNTDSLEEALTIIARSYGDSDSNCAVAGQLLGAIYGFDAIPKRWVEAVNQYPLSPKVKPLDIETYGSLTDRTLAIVAPEEYRSAFQKEEDEVKKRLEPLIKAFNVNLIDEWVEYAKAYICKEFFDSNGNVKQNARAYFSALPSRIDNEKITIACLDICFDQLVGLIESGYFTVKSVEEHDNFERTYNIRDKFNQDQTSSLYVHAKQKHYRIIEKKFNENKKLFEKDHILICPIKTTDEKVDNILFRVFELRRRGVNGIFPNRMNILERIITEENHLREILGNQADNTKIANGQRAISEAYIGSDNYHPLQIKIRAWLNDDAVAHDLLNAEVDKQLQVLDKISEAISSAMSNGIINETKLKSKLSGIILKQKQPSPIEAPTIVIDEAKVQIKKESVADERVDRLLCRIITYNVALEQFKNVISKEPEQIDKYISNVQEIVTPKVYGDLKLEFIQWLTNNTTYREQILAWGKDFNHLPDHLDTDLLGKLYTSVYLYLSARLRNSPPISLSEEKFPLSNYLDERFPKKQPQKRIMRKEKNTQQTEPATRLKSTVKEEGKKSKKIDPKAESLKSLINDLIKTFSSLSSVGNDQIIYKIYIEVQEYKHNKSPTKDPEIFWNKIVKLCQHSSSKDPKVELLRRAIAEQQDNYAFYTINQLTTLDHLVIAQQKREVLTNQLQNYGDNWHSIKNADPKIPLSELLKKINKDTPNNSSAMNKLLDDLVAIDPRTVLNFNQDTTRFYRDKNKARSAALVDLNGSLLNPEDGSLNTSLITALQNAGITDIYLTADMTVKTLFHDKETEVNRLEIKEHLEKLGFSVAIVTTTDVGMKKPPGHTFKHMFESYYRGDNMHLEYLMDEYAKLEFKYESIILTMYISEEIQSFYSKPNFKWYSAEDKASYVDNKIIPAFLEKIEEMKKMLSLIKESISKGLTPQHYNKELSDYLNKYLDMDIITNAKAFAWKSFSKHLANQILTIETETHQNLAIRKANHSKYADTKGVLYEYIFSQLPRDTKSVVVVDDEMSCIKSAEKAADIGLNYDISYTSIPVMNENPDQNYHAQLLTKDYLLQYELMQLSKRYADLKKTTHSEEIKNLISDVQFILQKSNDHEENTRRILDKIEDYFAKEERNFSKPLVGFFAQIGSQSSNFKEFLKGNRNNYKYPSMLLDILMNYYPEKYNPQSVVEIPSILPDRNQPLL